MFSINNFVGALILASFFLPGLNHLGRSKKTHKGARQSSLLEQESGTYLKKWTGRLPIALIYPNKYGVGVSSLGFQLVYSLLNTPDNIVCERFFVPEDNQSSLRSFESGRPLEEFSLLFIPLVLNTIMSILPVYC